MRWVSHASPRGGPDIPDSEAALLLAHSHHHSHKHCGTPGAGKNTIQRAAAAAAAPKGASPQHADGMGQGQGHAPGGTRGCRASEGGMGSARGASITPPQPIGTELGSVFDANKTSGTPGSADAAPGSAQPLTHLSSKPALLSDNSEAMVADPNPPPAKAAGNAAMGHGMPSHGVRAAAHGGPASPMGMDDSDAMQMSSEEGAAVRQAGRRGSDSSSKAAQHK